MANLSRLEDAIARGGYSALLDRVLITEEQLNRRVAELGAQISQDYAGKTPLLVCLLRGGVMFLADLMKHISAPHHVDFMAVSSYGVGARATRGQPRITLDLNTDVRGRHVLLVEDIIDSGHTIDHVLRLLQTREPASLRVCALLNKPARREVYVPISYLGFEIPDEFVFGYGLDLDEYFRNLPFIGVVKKEYQ
ncbi:MAG: hypoxanthine phosphoribosyltransferase [Chloroflexi bacterium]|jgi:hypoxanthine phosphoribosyltransferase|uniref:Hypoxanthine phosphoribosyltransferase n=1 Tax=Candidatus Thermofonsia Clade 3 bacterium TaxID=2364212 RepID=A0A2M8QFN7_9CHLR|nr:hypoxanthine phosphoribosyltransferase [Candidatus Roseilinea sp. NK_OTU-006]PJF48635.1 MAG: hypoxanthine phosphoribosyltransferase [Candidatus Thermofonsia Clade 3 bacterium]RMG63258.1 MAG: hypoxanthine phosphoribosyltransferase [Chloroflexota bacterium]